MFFFLILNSFWMFFELSFYHVNTVYSAKRILVFTFFNKSANAITVLKLIIIYFYKGKEWGKIFLYNKKRKVKEKSEKKEKDMGNFFNRINWAAPFFFLFLFFH